MAWSYYLLVAVESMPLPLKLIGWIGAIIIALWSCAQSIEYFIAKYKEFGPSVFTAAHHSWIESPWKATLLVSFSAGTIFAIASGIFFYTWAKNRPLPKSRSSEVEPTPIPMSPTPTPQPNVNVTSINQSGGITAHTVNINEVQRSWGLTNDQLSKLTKRIASFAPAGPENADLITAVLGDQASIKFAQILCDAFRNAHWKGVGGSGFAQAVLSGPAEGIIIRVHDKDDRPPGFEEFVMALNEVGIEPILHVVPEQVSGKDEFRILVGSPQSRK